MDLNALTVSRIFGPDTPVADDSLSPETLNGDPNSRHTYSGLAYMANIDRLFSFGGSLSGNGNFSRATWTYNFANNTWQNMNPSGPLPRTDSCCPEAAYDSNTGKVFVQSADGLFAYNSALTVILSFPAVEPLYKSAVIDPVNKKFVAVGAGNVIVYDIPQVVPMFNRHCQLMGEMLLLMLMLQDWLSTL